MVELFYMLAFEWLIFLLSSFVTLAAIYYKLSNIRLQQITALLIIIILFILNRYVFSRSRGALTLWPKLALLFFSSLMIQMIVLSTGGFFSPFLILLYLYFLGISFLLNLQASISFLIFSVIVLIANIWLSRDLFALFRDDPFSFILYLISFMVIIPLAQFLNRSYHIKDTLSRMLSEHLYQGKLREKSILQGLNELVLVTDQNLKILSINQAVEEIVGLLSTDIIGRKFLDILTLQYKDGTKATTSNLSIDQILTDKTARIINGFTLIDKSGDKAEVTIRINPIADLNKGIDQFVFVIKEGDFETILSSAHRDLDRARNNFGAAFADFTKTLRATNSPALNLRASLLRKMEEDILLAQEIEDHPIKETVSFPDVAEVCQGVLISKEEFAKNLNVSLQFVLPPEETTEVSRLSLRAQKVQYSVLSPVSSFSIPIDSNWLKVILEKLLDISILLVSDKKDPKIQLILSRENDRIIEISVISTPLYIPEKDQKELLTEYFGKLGETTNLKLGSGLEGFIAQRVTEHLKIPLNIRSEIHSNKLIFSLKVEKDRIQNIL